MARVAKCKWTKGTFDPATGKRIAKGWRADTSGGKAHCAIVPAGRRDHRGRITYDLRCDSWSGSKHQGSAQFGALAEMKRWGCNFLAKY